MGVLPMTAVFTGSAVAQAAPAFIAPQPGVTNPNTAPENNTTPQQPGVTPPNSADAVRTPPAQTHVSPADDRAGVAPESDYAPIREVPQRDYITPIQPQELHAPEPTPDVAEIVPVARVLRAGDIQMAAPDWLSAEQIDGLNSSFARPESEISRFGRSVGLSPSRADSVAAGAVAGAVQGAVIGCAAGSTLQIVTSPITLGLSAMLTPLTCITWGGTGMIAGAIIGAGQGGLR